MEKATPPSSAETRKRGRPKGSSNKAKAEKDKDAGDSAGDNRNASGDATYAHWKQLVPVLYDWLASHNLVWPSLSCRWGPVIEKGNYKNKQRLYLSEQTGHTQPNTLIIANCEVVKPHVAAESQIANFNEDARSPYVKKYKTILHPGEVNRIRELPQNKNIVATHTDCPEVFIWDVEAQPNQPVVRGATASCPNLVLSGHQDNAGFALAMCPLEPFVLSGGKDKLVLLWSIPDHVSTLATDGTLSAESASSTIKATNKSRVDPRGTFYGHTDTVEDVQFSPSSSQQFCSVGDDFRLILWDARIGTNPVVKVEKAHNADLHCVFWSPHDENYILTGSADHMVFMFDRRSLTTSNGIVSPVHKFDGHKAAVLCVQWSPDKHSVFGSSAEDGLVNIWDYEKVGQKEESGSKSPSTPAGLFFRHAGHRDKVVDFQWNGDDPWTIASVSDDGGGGGGTLQLWRITDLLHKRKEDVVAELQKFKDHVLDECAKTSTCTS